MKKKFFENWHFVLVVIAAGFIAIGAGEIVKREKQRELTELKLKVIIMEKDIEIKKLENRVLELMLDIE